MIIIKEDFEKFLDYVHLRINLWVLLFLKIFALNSVCATVTCITAWRLQKFVDIVWSTVFHRNRVWVSATNRAITKADGPLKFPIFHCRMRAIQPTWPVCTTSACFHTRCWHFCSCSSHKTIPSLRVDCHTPLNREALRNLSFYRHYSGFCNDNMDRLQIEIIITRELRLLEMTTTFKKKVK